MKCRKCGINNPINVNKCIYCGASLTQSNNPKVKQRNINNQPRNNQRKSNSSSKKQRTQTDNIIIGVVIALALILITMVGIYAFQNFAPKKRGFSGGGGGGGIVLSTSNQPAQTNNDIDVSLDGEDPDVEIYSFNTDTYDIPVGTTKKVKFTAEIFINTDLEENDVSVVSDTGTVLGYMNDNGSNGDTVANDGIYTLVAEMHSETRKSLIYQVKAKNVVSNSIEIFFYTDITAEDYSTCKTTISKVSELNDVERIKQFLSGNSSVESYSVSPKKDIIKYKMKSGIVCVWEKNQSNNDVQVKGLGNDLYDVEPFLDYTNVRNQISQSKRNRVHADGDVCVVRPFRGTQFTYDDFLDAGNILSGVLKGKIRRFDDGNANLDVFKSFDEYGVVLIDSHGTLSNVFNSAWTIVNTDPYLLTGTQFNGSQSLTSADWQAERVVVCSTDDLFGGFFGGGIVAVGGKFFDRYYTDNSLNGSAFYLGTCYSMRNDTIADVLIKKGAEVVYGFSETVSVGYCNEILQELFMNQFIMGMSTARDGFTNSRQARGNVDPYTNNNCELRIKGDDSFVLVTDKGKGKLAGSVKDAADSRPIQGALIRIYANGDLVESIRTDVAGYYNIELTEGDYIIKVSYGRYKSAKVSVTVTENVTTYVETLLMLDASLNSGYAKGTITDATTGDEVSGVSVKLRKSWNNKNGSVIQTTATNENGYYEFTHNPGFYTIEYSKDGYITGYKNIIIGIVDFEAQNAVISPEMPDDGNFRIVLSWSNKPRDLDSHLTGPTANGDRFHLYYKYANTSNRNGNSDYYQLDLDNTDIVSRPNIPETTTIVTQLDGVYRYSVHDYTNRGNGDSDAMSQSNATVNVYKGSALVATYHVPPNVKGSIWTVFELSGNEIKPINKIGNGLEDDVSKF